MGKTDFLEELSNGIPEGLHHKQRNGGGTTNVLFEEGEKV